VGQVQDELQKKAWQIDEKDDEIKKLRRIAAELAEKASIAQRVADKEKKRNMDLEQDLEKAKQEAALAKYMAEHPNDWRYVFTDKGTVREIVIMKGGKGKRFKANQVSSTEFLPTFTDFYPDVFVAKTPNLALR
jgi:hypothetical protein